MKNSDILIDAESQGLYPEHFGVNANRLVYSAMLYLNSKDTQPSPMAIMEVLTGKSKGVVDELGGLEYLMLLQESGIPEDSAQIFIEKIKQSHTRKMLYNLSEETKEFVLSEEAETLNPDELVFKVESQISNIASSSANEQDIYKMGDETESILDERAESPSQIPGLEFGWPQYDKYTNGAQPGDLIILVAPSKTGKSTTLTNWATKVGIEDKLPVLYIDTEMNSREQEDRILANLTGIPIDEIVSGMYVMDTHNGTADEKIALLKEAREKLNLGNYYHAYMPQFTIESVSSMVRRFQMKFGIVALFFDYIKVSSNQANFKEAQEYQKLGFFASGLKDLAGMLQIPVISAGQANRSDVGTDDPDEGDIGGSYRILQLATKLIFLYNKSEERIARDGFQAGNQLLIIKWQRNGQSDCPPINIMFDKSILRQVEV